MASVEAATLYPNGSRSRRKHPSIHLCLTSSKEKAVRSRSNGFNAKGCV